MHKIVFKTEIYCLYAPNAGDSVFIAYYVSDLLKMPFELEPIIRRLQIK